MVNVSAMLTLISHSRWKCSREKLQWHWVRMIGWPTNISIKIFMTQHKEAIRIEKVLHTHCGHSIMPCLLTLTEMFLVWNCREWKTEEDTAMKRTQKKRVWQRQKESEKNKSPFSSARWFLFRQRNWTSDYEVDTHFVSNMCVRWGVLL